MTAVDTIKQLVETHQINVTDVVTQYNTRNTRVSEKQVRAMLSGNEPPKFYVLMALAAAALSPAQPKSREDRALYASIANDLRSECKEPHIEKPRKRPALSEAKPSTKVAHGAKIDQPDDIMKCTTLYDAFCIVTDKCDVKRGAFAGKLGKSSLSTLRQPFTLDRDRVQDTLAAVNTENQLLPSEIRHIMGLYDAKFHTHAPSELAVSR